MAKLDRALSVLVAGLSTVWAVATTACGGSSNDQPIPTKPVPAQPAVPPPAPAAQQARGAADAGAAEPTGLPPLPLREFGEKDFSETDSNRDPFRNYSNYFFEQAKQKVTIQRKVLVDNYALDELKLVGVVTKGASRVLLQPPQGQSCIASVGDFVGKAEVVHSGGPTGADVAINWRIDRIRDDDVVFVREDPSHPEIPPTTHVVSLRTAADLGTSSLLP